MSFFNAFDTPPKKETILPFGNDFGLDQTVPRKMKSEILFQT
jgi:hypothetical protein